MKSNLELYDVEQISQTMTNLCGEKRARSKYLIRFKFWMQILVLSDLIKMFLVSIKVINTYYQGADRTKTYKKRIVQKAPSAVQLSLYLH